MVKLSDLHHYREDAMDVAQIDRIAARLSARLTRRRGLAVLGFLGVAGALPGGDVSAGKKRRKKRKKRSVGGAPSPVARADASCIVTNSIGAGDGWNRVAQSFLALRTGQLTSASVLLQSNDDGMDFDVEIRTVNQFGAPDALLGGTTISDVPATVFPGPRRLAATFPTPIPVVAGTRYALVITKGANADFVAVAGNPCADGNSFYGDVGGSYFPAPNVDMHFETVVTA